MTASPTPGQPARLHRRALLAALAAALPLAARAPRARAASRVYRLGVLSTVAPREAWTGLVDALRELGYEEGRNLAIEYRYAAGRTDSLAALAAELVGLRPDIVVVSVNPEAMAVKQATGTIPIVMTRALAPVETGLIASLARPGANLTGVTLQAPETAGKILEVLRDAVPGLRRVTVLWEPDFPGMEPYRQATERAATTLRIRVTLVPARSEREIDQALARLPHERPDGLFVVTTGVIHLHRARVIEAAARHRIPAVYTNPNAVAEGGLLSYTADFEETLRRGAVFIDRILKGAKPADLPVEQPSKYRLAINLRAARALGLTIPGALRLRADEVID